MNRAESSRVTLNVNGEPRTACVDNRMSVLDLLRENLGLTGSKKGCDHAECGACTVLLGGRRVNACLLLAVACDGEDITTAEGLPRVEGLPRQGAPQPGSAPARQPGSAPAGHERQPVRLRCLREHREGDLRGGRAMRPFA